MKFESFPRRKGRPSPQVRTLAELAEEIGIAEHTLYGIIGNDKRYGRVVPEQQFNTRGGTVKKSYYLRSEVLRWWKSRDHACAQ